MKPNTMSVFSPQAGFFMHEQNRLNIFDNIYFLHRMTSNLDLMELTASHDQDIVNPKPPIVDLKAVLDAISAVNISACTSNGQHILQYRSRLLFVFYEFSSNVYLHYSSNLD